MTSQRIKYFHDIPYFDDCIAELHRIADFELASTAIYVDGQTAVDQFCNTLQDMNSQGILHPEVVTLLTAQYKDNESFRRLMGSISMNFEFWIKAKLGLSVHEFSSNIHEIIRFELSPNESTILDDNVIGHRADTDIRFKEDLSAHVNFWLICLVLLRMTLHNSKTVAARIASNMALKTVKSRAPKQPTAVIPR